MVKDHSDSETGNPLPPHRLLLSINSKGSFICTTHRQDNTYHGLCYTSCGALAGMRNNNNNRPIGMTLGVGEGELVDRWGSGGLLKTFFKEKKRKQESQVGDACQPQPLPLL